MVGLRFRTKKEKIWWFIKIFLKKRKEKKRKEAKYKDQLTV